jgi:dihydroorotate dehydrogenase
LILKIGWLPDRDQTLALVDAVTPFANALSMTNCIAALVTDEQSRPVFQGAPRGIGGKAILEASLAQVRTFHELIRRGELKLIAVGGASSAADVRAYLDCGAQAVHMATAAMLNPLVAIEIRRAWSATMYKSFSS